MILVLDFENKLLIVWMMRPERRAAQIPHVIGPGFLIGIDSAMNRNKPAAISHEIHDRLLLIVGQRRIALREKDYRLELLQIIRRDDREIDALHVLLVT